MFGYNGTNCLKNSGFLGMNLLEIWHNPVNSAILKCYNIYRSYSRCLGYGKNAGRNWEHYGNDMGNKCVYNNSIQYWTLLRLLANVAKVVKIFGNIMAVTRQ